MKQVIDKLYEKTPDATLGALAASAFLRADKDDIQDIYTAIGHRSAGAQLKFACAAHHQTEAALLWALDCARTYRQILELTCVLATADDISDGQYIKAALFLKEALQRRLASLITAMEKICDDNGLDFASVSDLAGIDGMTPVRGKPPAMPALVAEFVAQYGITS